MDNEKDYKISRCNNIKEIVIKHKDGTETKVGRCLVAKKYNDDTGECLRVFFNCKNENQATQLIYALTEFSYKTGMLEEILDDLAREKDTDNTRRN